MKRKEKRDPKTFKPIRVALILLAVDTGTILFSYLVAYFVRWLLIPLIGGVMEPLVVLPGFLIFLTFVILQNWRYHLYPGFGMTGLFEYRALFSVITSSMVVTGILIYFLNFAYDVSRVVFVLTAALTFVFLPATRLFTHRVGSRMGWWGKPVILYGGWEDCEKLIRYLRSSHRIALIPQAVVLSEGGAKAPTNLGVPTFADDEEVWQGLRSRGYDQVIAVENSIQEKKISMESLLSISSRFPIVDIVLSDPVLNVFSLQIHEMNGSPMLRNQYNLLRPGILFAKRVFDLIFSVFTLVITLPVYLLIAVAIRLDDGGEVLYSQDRLGKHGKIFKIYKFRTMTPGAHNNLQDILEADDEARKQYELHHKLPNDPRLTRVGRVIRKIGLDELPQVINVFKGEMSWVGPRAYMPEELDRIGDSAALIHNATPGITGWWQVNGRNKLTFEKRVELDRYYISNFSPLMDLFIIYKTIFLLLEADGM